MEITVQQLSPDEVQRRGIGQWPIWQKETSDFGWFYEQTEECLILEGRVRVRTETQLVDLNPGDFVVFPAGLACHWHIEEPVRKHYQFR